MRIRLLALGIAFVASVSGQGRKAPKSFNWQDYCFNHSAAPFCAGNDYALKPPRPGLKGKDSSVTRGSASGERSATPTMTVVGGIDWYFVDPFADAIMGVNFGRLAASPLVHSLIAELGAKQGLGEDDLKQVFDRLTQIDQLAVSVRGQDIAVMLTGAVTDSAFSAAQVGMKISPVGVGAVLAGRSDVVDQAASRISLKYPTTEIMRLAEALDEGSDFWVIGAARLAGPQAVSSGLKRFSVTATVQDQVWTDVVYEFNGAPSPAALKALQGTLGPLTVEGGMAHSSLAIDSAQAAERIHELVNSPVGQQLGALVAAAKYLPARDTGTPKRTKPVIYGLDDGAH